MIPDMILYGISSKHIGRMEPIWSVGLFGLGIPITFLRREIGDRESLSIDSLANRLTTGLMIG